MSSRTYDIVLLGATGYTGKFTAEYIQEHARTNLKWAIAGRNGQRLESIAAELKTLNADRVQPAIEVVSLDAAELDALAKKTTVLISTVGPYWKFGSPVVEACAKNGTHYLDVTGEVPWVYEMLQKYHETAKANGSFIIPQCGIDSVPADLLAWLLVRHVRKTLNTGVREVVNSLQKISGAISGGTATTAISLIEAYPLKVLRKSMHPFALCPIPAPPKFSPGGILSKLLGYRTVPDLGVLTTSPQAGSDIPIVNRSWGLFDNGALYGPNFRFSEYMRTRNAFTGALTAYAFGLLMLGLVFKPIRSLLKRLAYAPGEGQTKEEAKHNVLRYKATAVADAQPARRAVATFDYTGPGYYLTGVMLAEAALEVLDGGDFYARKIGGGMVTPATLGEGYVERLRKAGCKIEVDMLD
ncbi:NAD(P)-binding protein [Trichodelitschia bisporula]|uniref:NAD(P)-binding protein n=1 Tax=Trichodelitschia bisporula TaxID=703511 RepID=A0A6G1HX74_9PEZI|nr:NAD(P)-binding protein [Trichodelitschia bisporula]